jgi:hypothetical protein
MDLDLASSLEFLPLFSPFSPKGNRLVASKTSKFKNFVEAICEKG